MKATSLSLILMDNTIKYIKKELSRIGCTVTVTAVEGLPGLCQINDSGHYSGQYQGERLLSALTQLRTPDAGEDDCQDVYATLAQVGFEVTGR